MNVTPLKIDSTTFVFYIFSVVSFYIHYHKTNKINRPTENKFNLIIDIGLLTKPKKKNVGQVAYSIFCDHKNDGSLKKKIIIIRTNYLKFK